jgi:hypothetical protein
VVIHIVTADKDDCEQSVTTAWTEHQQSVNRALPENQRIFLLHLVKSTGCAIAFTQNHKLVDRLAIDTVEGSVKGDGVECD